MKAAFLSALLVIAPMALAAPDEPKVQTIVVRADVADGAVVADGSEKPNCVAVVTRVETETDADPDHGWLGIALGNSDDDSGVVVLNVVKDSPAQAAGLAEGDVLLSINGTSIDDYKTAVDTIREVGPGALAAITVDRDGQMLNLSAKLSSRPQTMTWVKEPEGFNFRDIHKGNVFLWTPQGQQQLGDGLFNINKSVTVENGEKTITIEVARDDDSFTLARVGDGPITVERNGVINEYADAAALEAADPDAAEVFNQCENNMMFMPLHGGMRFHFGDADTDFTNLLPEDFEVQLHQHLQDALKGARMDIQLDGLDGDLGGAKMMTFDFGKARRSFKALPDGQIEVTVRSGGDELVTVYSNEADLQTRAPELYEKYLDLLDADVADME